MRHALDPFRFGHIFWSNGLGRPVAQGNAGRPASIRIQRGSHDDGLILFVLIKAEMTEARPLAVRSRAAIDETAILGPFVIDKQHSRRISPARALDFVAVIETPGVLGAIRDDQPWCSVGLDDIDAMDANPVELSDFSRALHRQ